MNPHTLAAAALVAAAVAVSAVGREPADPPKPTDPAPQGRPLDTSFLKQYAETRGFMLGRPQKPKVTPDGKAVLFLRAEPKTPKMKLYEFDVATGQTKELLSPESLLKGADEDLTPAEKARRERQRVTVGGFADFHLSPDGRRVLVKLSNTLFVLDRATGRVTELKIGTDGAIVDPKWSPDGKLVGYVRGYDVYVYDLDAGKEIAATTGGTAVKTHGLAEFVAQEEMGRHSGFWWSPDSKSIAYEEADHTGVEQWFVADPLKPDVPPNPQYYPRPGKKNVAVRLGVKPISGGETVWVEWDRGKYEYLAQVAFGKQAVMVVVQSRRQNVVEVLVADPRTGKSLGGMSVAIKSRWLETPPEPRLSDSGDQFRCFIPTAGGVEAGGPGHWAFDLYEMEVAAGDVTISPVCKLDEFLGADDKADVVFHASRTDPTQTHIFRWHTRRMDQPGGQDGGERLTTEPGIHSAVLSKDRTRAVITSTTLATMTVTKVRVPEPDGGTLGTLPSVALEPPFKPNVTVQKVGDYWTAVVRPRDFDPKKKYPVILDVYGGPKHLHVVQAMRNWLVPQWLADQGFIVVAIDNRGTPGRGRDWEKAIYQKFGTVPLEDQVKGMHALCDQFPELDRDRVGVAGWSFGGYTAANGVLRRPDVFKAAVAGAPVTDWEDYDTHYTERYLGLLPESKTAYDEASLIPLAPKLERPLLLVHGTADDNVYYRHTLKLSDALFRAGKDFEALALPGVTHMYSADPVVMERLWAKSATFFKRHLGGPK